MSAAASTNTIGNELPPEAQDGDAAPARKLDPGFKRNVLVIGAVAAGLVLLVVVMVLIRSGGNDKNTVPVTTSLRESTVDNGNDRQPLSPAMRDALRSKQLDEQKKAEQNGDPVFIPKDTLASPVSLSAAPPSVPPIVPASQEVPAQVPVSATESARNDRRRQGLEIQLAQLLGANGDQGGASPQRVSFENKGLAPTAPASSGATGGAVLPKTPPVVEGLEIVPAETASPIDTYRTKYASARVVAGKLAGAFLIGTSELVEEGLSTKYNMMRFNGKTYAIDAIALDEKTSTDAMNADIDHRYLQRYVMPVVSAAIGGAATALAQTGSQVVATAGGVLGATPAPTAQQARMSGLAAGTSIVQRQVEKEAQKPLQATLPAGTAIGILFRTPVEAAK